MWVPYLKAVKNGRNLSYFKKITTKQYSSGNSALLDSDTPSENSTKTSSKSSFKVMTKKNRTTCKC